MHLNALVAFIADRSEGFVRPALRRVRSATAITFALLFLLSPVSARQQPPVQPTFRSGTDLVVVNVVVRDKNGDLVRDLTREDFTLVEDNRPQSISTFDFEQLDLA